MAPLGTHEVRHLEDRLRAGRAHPRREGRLALSAPQHRRDEGRAGLVGRGGRLHVLPVAKYGDPVRHLENVVDEVRDVDDRPSLVPERSHRDVEVPDLVPRERRSGLVHHDDPGIARERPQDLDLLPIRDREPGDDRVGVEAESARRHQLFEAAPLGAAKNPEALLLEAEEDVLGDGELRHELELLVHDRDAPGEGEERVPGVRALAEYVEGAGARGVVASEHLAEGRLAGPVLADEPVDLAGQDVQRHVAEHRYPGERDPDSGRRECRPCGHRPPPSVRRAVRSLLHPRSCRDRSARRSRSTRLPGKHNPVRRRPAPPRRGAPSDRRCPRPRRSWSRPRSPPRRAGPAS